MINVIFYEQFKVQNPQQIPVTVYDYYNPGTVYGIIIHVVVTQVLCAYNHNSSDTGTVHGIIMVVTTQVLCMQS